MNIFLQELKSNGKSLFFWILGICLLITEGMWEYTKINAPGSNEALSSYLDKMPSGVQAVFGVGTFDLSAASGYYGMLFPYFLLIATMHAITLGATIISKEERDRTAEFLYVKPVSRHRILTSKLGAAVVNLVVLNLATILTSLLVGEAFGNGENFQEEILLLCGAMGILQLVFLFIGTATSVLVKKSKSAAYIGSGVILGVFIFSYLIDMNKKLDFFKYFTPYKYFDGKNIYTDMGYEVRYLALSGGIILISVLGTYIFHKKRDLNC